jgi:hypothetical protein
VVTLTDKKHDGNLQVNIVLNFMPEDTSLKIKVMEYGDFSSLLVEYPDYNSLGKVLYMVHEIQTPKKYIIDGKKYQFTLNLNKELTI